MIIEETERTFEIEFIGNDEFGWVNLNQDNDCVLVDMDQIPALIAALQKFYDGEVI